MRRVLIIAATALLVCPTVSAQSSKLLKVKPGYGDMTVSIGGLKFKLGPTERKDEFISIDYFCPLQIGMTALSGDFSYPDPWFIRNIAVSDDIISLKVGGKRLGSLFLSTGVRLSCFNYFMADGRAIYIDEYGVPYRNGEEVYSKSKLKLCYLGVPVSAGMKLTDRFSIGATATFDLLIDARNKLSSPKILTRLDNLNRYRCSAELFLVDKDGLGFFVNYGLTPVFLKSSGINAHTVSFGFRLLN